MTAVFALRDVTLRRDGRPILQGIDWTIEEGERWVVLGPNGAGKTTLVRILSTYMIASSGRVEVLGKRVGRTNLQALRPFIGYLSPALAHEIPEELTPRQIVDAAQAGALFPWYVEPERMSRRLTDAALDQVGMGDAGERPFASFSSGEQLRIQLARALVTEPRALLLDEPMASLDIGGRETLVTTLARVAAGPIAAVVVVLHRLEDIAPGFTHALLMRDGRILAAGPMREVVTDDGLSACFGTPLRVVPDGERWSVRPA
ncbi:MAG TPA: ATP-binding cassette domain-containing protein [Patescibacteria group bacterium]|nr:ATP-binding cassette domain-containing protein [Patescibacteria group bacterium]